MAAPSCTEPIESSTSAVGGRPSERFAGADAGADRGFSVKAGRVPPIASSAEGV
jgi:hypothetical protein